MLFLRREVIGKSMTLSCAHVNASGFNFFQELTEEVAARPNLLNDNL